MSKHTYKEILNASKTITLNVRDKYKLGTSTKWSYYIAKAIINPKKDIKKISIDTAPKPTGTHISRQIKKSDYLKIAKELITFVEKHHRLPNYIQYGKYQIRTRLYTLMLAKVLVSYSKNNKLPDEVNVNSKAFTKPLETSNSVYAYFIKVFNKGKKITSVDGILKPIQGRGYGYYYDDKLSNKQVIDQLAKNSKDDPSDPNCTDSCQMVQNCIQQLVDWGLYKKVECLHVNCSSGGHVKLRITRKDGSTFIRDPACVISHNGKPLECVWCTNSPKAVNPSWYMANLHR